MEKSKDELKKEVIEIIKDFANEKNLNVVSTIDIAKFYKGFTEDFFELFHKRKMNRNIDVVGIDALINFIYDNKDMSFNEYLKFLHGIEFLTPVPFESLGFVQRFSYLNLYGFLKSLDLASINSNVRLQHLDIRT